MRARLAATGVAALAAAVLASPAAGAASRHHAPGVRQLSGTLRLTPGSCAGGRPSGSYLAVTYGTKSIDNPASSCDGGAVTLLSPGTRGLSTTSFSPSSDVAFNRRGEALSSSIAEPVRFGSHLLGIVSATQDLQDAPDGPGLFALPHIYVTGGRVLADVRSVQALYDRGCWLVGAERATGTYDAANHRLTLSWFSGQSFVSQSAGTAVHLAGVFVGAAPKPIAAGNVVELGTASFAAGSPAPATASAPRRSSTSSKERGGAAESASAPLASLDESPLTQVMGSPLLVAAAVVLVGLDALGFAAAIGRRRRS